MRAAFYDRRGPAREVLQLGDIPTPEPGPGEVRVRVHASAVTASDTESRGGWGGPAPMPFPRVVPLERVAEGHEAQDSGATVGKIVADVA